MARVVVALGGNALLQRGQEMTAANQRCRILVLECVGFAI